MGARTLFQLCDSDGQRNQPYTEKSLNRMELLRFVSQGVKDRTTKKMINGLTTELFQRLDSDNSNHIQFQEFITRVNEDTEVWNILKALSPFMRTIAAADAEATYFETVRIESGVTGS